MNGVSSLSIAAFLIAAAPAWAAPSNGTVAGSVKIEGAPVKNLVVYIERVAQPAGTVPPPATVEQRNTQFAPGSLVVVAGQTVQFPNLDKFYHNVFSRSPGNEFDLGLYRAGASKSLHLDQPGEVEIYCNIHPDMAARILVLQNNLHTTVNGDGSYRLADVPPGQYTLVAWSPAHEPQKRAIDVKAGEAVRADFTLKLRAEPKSHLNKNGEQYGRYR